MQSRFSEVEAFRMLGTNIETVGSVTTPGGLNRYWGLSVQYRALSLKAVDSSLYVPERSAD